MLTENKAIIPSDYLIIESPNELYNGITAGLVITLTDDDVILHLKCGLLKMVITTTNIIGGVILFFPGVSGTGNMEGITWGECMRYIATQSPTSNPPNNMSFHQWVFIDDSKQLMFSDKMITA